MRSRPSCVSQRCSRENDPRGRRLRLSVEPVRIADAERRQSRQLGAAMNDASGWGARSTHRRAPRVLADLFARGPSIALELVRTNMGLASGVASVQRRCPTSVLRRVLPSYIVDVRAHAAAATTSSILFAANARWISDNPGGGYVGIICVRWKPDKLTRPIPSVPQVTCKQRSQRYSRKRLFSDSCSPENVLSKTRSWFASGLSDM